MDTQYINKRGGVWHILLSKNLCGQRKFLPVSFKVQPNPGDTPKMKYLHTMVRVLDLDKSLNFYVGLLGLKEMRRRDSEGGRFTLVFLATAEGEPPLELTYNWDQAEPYPVGRNFGHLAYSVENIYDLCTKLQDAGVTILRPPRDGRMAFVRCPDNVSIELLQAGEALPQQEPWASMPSQGEW